MKQPDPKVGDPNGSSSNVLAALAAIRSMGDALDRIEHAVNRRTAKENLDIACRMLFYLLFVCISYVIIRQNILIERSQRNVHTDLVSLQKTLIRLEQRRAEENSGGARDDPATTGR